MKSVHALICATLATVVLGTSFAFPVDAKEEIGNKKPVISTEKKHKEQKKVEKQEKKEKVDAVKKQKRPLKKWEILYYEQHPEQWEKDQQKENPDLSKKDKDDDEYNWHRL